MDAGLLGSGADGLQVEGEREAFLGRGEIEKGGANDALGCREGLVEGSKTTLKPAKKMALLMEGGEEGSIATKEIDVGDDGGSALLGLKGEVETQVLALFDGGFPDVALGGEKGRAGGVKRAESVLEGGVIFGFGDAVDGVWVFAEIDEAKKAGGIFPGDDQNRIVNRAFGGPVKEHVCVG